MFFKIKYNAEWLFKAIPFYKKTTCTINTNCNYLVRPLYTLQKKKRKTISKKETQNHIQKKKRKTTYWWHWEDNFNCCMVGPQGLHFCKSEFGHLWPTAQNLDILGPTAIKIIFPMSPICGFAFLFLNVVLRFFFWNGFAFLFLKSITLANIFRRFEKEIATICYKSRLRC